MVKRFETQISILGKSDSLIRLSLAVLSFPRRRHLCFYFFPDDRQRRTSWDTTILLPRSLIELVRRSCWRRCFCQIQSVWPPSAIADILFATVLLVLVLFPDFSPLIISWNRVLGQTQRVSKTALFPGASFGLFSWAAFAWVLKVFIEPLCGFLERFIFIRRKARCFRPSCGLISKSFLQGKEGRGCLVLGKSPSSAGSNLLSSELRGWYVNVFITHRISLLWSFPRHHGPCSFQL